MAARVPLLDSRPANTSLIRAIHDSKHRGPTQVDSKYAMRAYTTCRTYESAKKSGGRNQPCLTRELTVKVGLRGKHKHPANNAHEKNTLTDNSEGKTLNSSFKQGLLTKRKQLLQPTSSAQC